MSKSLQKAYEISNVKISFVSLVDRAANKRTFLIQKAENGKAQFSSYGRIVKADGAESHYVTGIVYEPMEEDTDGNFMREDEIIKAAHWFMKNGNSVDLQHSFVAMDGAQVVESWVAKSDFDIDGEAVKKGTWLMTVEITDEAVWKAIQDGSITGFSMGGLGDYSEEDVTLEDVEKSVNNAEKKGILKSIAKALGFSVVTKGEVAELYQKSNKGTLFWNAFNALESTLRKWDYFTDEYRYETDEEKIKEALEDFAGIISELLTGSTSVAEAIVPDTNVAKAGKAMSRANLETLCGIRESLDKFLKAFEPEDEPENKDKETEEDDKSNNTDDTVEKSEDKEELAMTQQEVETIVKSAVEAALAKADEEKTADTDEEKKAAEEESDKSTEEKKDDKVTKEAVETMVAEAVAKALEPIEKEEAQVEVQEVEKSEELTMEAVEEIVNKAITKAVEPVLKSRGVPTHLDTEPVEKSTEHYLHGIL